MTPVFQIGKMRCTFYCSSPYLQCLATFLQSVRRKYKMLQYSCVKSVIMCDNNAARSELISLELSPESQPNCWHMVLQTFFFDMSSMHRMLCILKGSCHSINIRFANIDLRDFISQLFNLKIVSKLTRLIATTADLNMAR